MTGSPGKPDPLPFKGKPTLLKRFVLAPTRIRALQPRLEQARMRSPLIDATLATVERDSDIGGGILAGALAYRLFLFFLPLVFFAVATLGLVSDASGRDPRSVANRIGLVAVVSREVATTSESGGSVFVALTAFVVLVYVTRVLYRAIAVVHALAWERSAASARTTSRSLAVFSAAIIAQLIVTAGISALRAQTGPWGILAFLPYVLLSAGLWLAVALRLPHGQARWSDLVPGSVLYGVAS